MANSIARRLGAGLLGLALVTPAGAPVAMAHDARVLSASSAITALVLDGDPGDWITLGQPWTWLDASVYVAPDSTAAVLHLVVLGDSIFLAAPSGGTLTPGTYENAMRYPAATMTVPGLSVSNLGRTCTAVTGRFVVHESAFGPGGLPTVFAASIEQHCDGAAAATWAEIRLNSTVGLEAATISPFGDADQFFGYQVIGGPGLTKTFTLTSAGNADLTVGTVSAVATGGEAGFSVGSQTCTGATLAPGGTCTIDVHFAPAADSAAYADIRIADSGTRTSHVLPVRGAGMVGSATNDAIADAIAVTSLPYHLPEHTDVATTAPDDPTCFGATNTVWFSFTPPTSGAIQAETTGSWFPTALCVFKGSPDALVPVASNDDWNGYQYSLVVFPAVAGTTYYLMAGANAGSAGGRLEFGLKTGPSDKVVSASGVGVSYGSFYPYSDGYRDTVLIRGKLAEWGSVNVTVYSPTNARVRTFSNPNVIGSYGFAWNGRTASGTAVVAGKYRVVQSLRDVLGNTLTTTTYTTVSWKRLATMSKTIALYGRQFPYYGDPGNGYVSTSSSAYSRGAKLSSGASWVAVGYAFSLPSAIGYKSATFKVHGRSPNGRRAWIALWNPSLGSYLDVGAYDATKRAGPAYGWYATSTSLAAHAKGGRARGLVLVQYESGPVVFDVAEVRLVVTYTVLK